MPQEPIPGHGRDDVPSAAARGPVPGTGGVAARAAGGYAAFEQGCSLDGEIASAVLGVVLDELAGPHRRPLGASDDAVLGMLGGADKLAAWCESLKLGLIRELIRRHPQPGTDGRRHPQPGPGGPQTGTDGAPQTGCDGGPPPGPEGGPPPGAGGPGPVGLPAAWARGLAQQLSAELAISAHAADTLLDTAYALARLPHTARALDTGIISGHKAQIIAAATSPLDDAQAAEADRRAAPKLAGKTPGEIREVIRRIVIAVDPDGAKRRREQAQREHARVEFWQDALTGTANLAGFALPTDEGLMCNQRIQDRALAYKKAKVFPDSPMDLLRIRAYIDLLLGRDARETTPAGAAGHESGHAAGGHAPAGDGRGADGGSNAADASTECVSGDHGQGVNAGHRSGQDTGADARNGNGQETGAKAGNGGSQGEDGNSGNGDGGAGTGGRDPADGGSPAGGTPAGSGPAAGAAAGLGGGPGLAANVNLTITLSTLLGLAGRPGHLAGLGAIDPALARDLAASAATSNRSTWCITVTNDQGHAIGHGCARPARRTSTSRHGTKGNSGNSGGTRTRDGPAFTRRDEQGPPGGYGNWTLTLPTGGEYTVHLGPIPVTECDHRYESHGYQPGRLLRHLVQIRDGTCDFPPCRRPAKQCDFEHTTPLPPRRAHRPVQLPAALPLRPPGQAEPGLVGDADPAGLARMAHPLRPPLPQRPHRTPHLRRPNVPLRPVRLHAAGDGLIPCRTR
ncbi:MAG: DUF222 domain-containing protein [Streptosporangiaceae bacterium]|nr:DUF222 domain-containing protein [Streptosporangiaceae bacterium]